MCELLRMVPRLEIIMESFVLQCIFVWQKTLPWNKPDCFSAVLTIFIFVVKTLIETHKPNKADFKWDYTVTSNSMKYDFIIEYFIHYFSLNILTLIAFVIQKYAKYNDVLRKIF